LVVRQIIENSDQRYDYLSWRTAAARRDGTFPDLMEQRRRIVVPQTFSSAEAAIRFMGRIYRRDRTEGQRVSLYLAVEKAAIETQLYDWFGRDLGVPILALGGYASQTYVDKIVNRVDSQNRPAVLLYAGDHDASGDDIYRDFIERTDCWDEERRIALTKEQVREFDLPENPGKDEDKRTPAFMQRHGYTTNIQVELDALAPDVLRGLYQDAIDDYWDDDAYQAVLDREDDERLGSDDDDDENEGDDEDQ
jgi:hypothetical protein